MSKLVDLVGEHILSGVEKDVVELEGGVCGAVKFTLDGATWMAVEDPEDGYRSHMDELKVVDEPCRTKLPDIIVQCSMWPDRGHIKNDVLSFVDVLSGKEVLAVGTEDTEDYYPCFIAKYNPENMHCNAKVANND